MTAAEQANAQVQAAEKEREALRQDQLEQVNRNNTMLGLQRHYQDLQDAEEALLNQIGFIHNQQHVVAEQAYENRLNGVKNGHFQLTAAGEANLPMLQNRLSEVRAEKKSVEQAMQRVATQSHVGQ